MCIYLLAPYSGQYLNVDGLSQAVEKKNVVYEFVDESHAKSNNNSGNSANPGGPKKMPAWFKPGLFRIFFLSPFSFAGK